MKKIINIKQQGNASSFSITLFSTLIHSFDSLFNFTKKYILITNMPYSYEKSWGEGLLLILYCAIAFLKYLKVEMLKYLVGWQHIFYCYIGKFSINICSILEVIEVVYEKKMLPRFPKVQTISLIFFS